MVETNKVADRWRRHFQKLSNVENKNEVKELPRTEGPIEDVTREEVEQAVKAMKNRKAPGPSGVAAEMLKLAGNTGISELQSVFRKIIEEEKCPLEWRRSSTIALYKGKGDPLECCNHRGLRLLEHGMKIWEKILDTRLRRIVNIGESQCGYRAEKSTTDAVFMVRQLQEKYLEKKKKLHHIFVDLEKAFDRVPRKAIRWALRRKKVPERLIRQVMALYEGSCSRVRVAGVESDEFNITVGVHQGSALSPLLFILVMDEATMECRRGDPWELLYADDLVLTAESREEVTEMLEDWKGALEKRGLR